MISLIGTYECVLDAKGRFLLPTGLKKQMESILDNGFVLKRSVFQPCIELHPLREWEKIMNKLNKLNRFVKKNNDFIRMFTAGVKNIEIDKNGRIQITKDLFAYAKFEKNIVINASVNIIEIWDKSLYEETITIDAADFASLAEDVMGNIDNELD